MWPVMGLPPVDAADQSSHEDCAPASAIGVPVSPGTDGIASVPVPGGKVVEPGTVVVTPLLFGTAVGSPNASLFGDNVPALVTTLLVAALMMALITADGDAAGTADK